MKVRDLMTPEVVTCAVGDDLAFAGNEMRDSICGGMPVIGEEGEVAGFHHRPRHLSPSQPA
jgi:CBS domain-containing protein